MSQALKILVVEDHDELRNAIIEVLAQQGHLVTGVSCAEDVDDTSTGLLPDLYIIDLNLPGEDGISLTQRIRLVQPDIPIIMATARDANSDRVKGYDCGADIYMPKPINLDELNAAINRFSRRKISAKDAIHDGDKIKVSIQNRELCYRNHKIPLTHREVTLLFLLSRAPQNTLEYWQIASHFESNSHISRKALIVQIVRLRKKLLDAGIPTPGIEALRGYGYKLLHPICVT